MKKNVAKMKRNKNYIYIYIFNHCFYSCWNFIVVLYNNPALSYRISSLPFLKKMNKGISKLRLKK